MVEQRGERPKLEAVPPEGTRVWPSEVVTVASLTGHKRNYRRHPPEQLEHVMASIREHGFYRNVVTASDLTILAGHGVVEACEKLGIEEIPIVRLPISPDDPKALKVIVGDNEQPNLADDDDRLLSELLREIAADDDLDLLGTGYDEMQLANLVYVTRNAGEIEDFDAAAEWVGMPEYDPADSSREKLPVLEITFKTKADRDKFVAEKQVKIASTREGRKWATMWPYVAKADLMSVKFEEVGE